MKKVMVAYASKAGSTVGVAENVASVLKEKGYQVDLLRAKEVKNLGGYDAVVFGTAIRMGKPIGEGMRFVRRHEQELKAKPVAVFSLGLAMQEDTPETRKQTEEFLAPVTKTFKPVSLAMFGGKLDLNTLNPFFRFAFSRDQSGKMAEGDWRNWDSIRAWAESLSEHFG